MPFNWVYEKSLSLENNKKYENHHNSVYPPKFERTDEMG